MIVFAYLYRLLSNINLLNVNNLLNNNALVICEITNNNLLEEINHLSLLKLKKYGEKYVLIYQNKL